MKLGDIAERLGLTLHGSPDVEIIQLSSITQSTPDSITFINAASFVDRLAECRAAAVILKPEWAEQCQLPYLESEQPYLSYARLSQLLYPAVEIASSIHETAIIDAAAVLEEGVTVGPRAVIEAGVSIGRGTQIGPGVVIGKDSRLGRQCRIYANVTIYHACEIGERVTVHSGTVIGSDGFGFANDQGKWVKIQQVGRVIIGNDVEIGANTTIDRGALKDTVLGDGVILDNQIQIAHNVTVGEHTAMAGCVGVAGSAEIGAYCAIGGAAVIMGHLSIVDHVTVTTMSLVTSSITEPGMYSSSIPVQPNRQWKRNHARLRQLEELAQRIKKLEKRSDG